MRYSRHIDAGGDARSATNAFLGRFDLVFVPELRVFQDQGTADLPGQASRPCSLHFVPRRGHAVAAAAALARKHDLDRRGVAQELRGGPARGCARQLEEQASRPPARRSRLAATSFTAAASTSSSQNDPEWQMLKAWVLGQTAKLKELTTMTTTHASAPVSSLQRHCGRDRSVHACPSARRQQGPDHPDQQRRGQRPRHRSRHEQGRRRDQRDRSEPRRGGRARRQPHLRQRRSGQHARRRRREDAQGHQADPAERPPEQHRRRQGRPARLCRHHPGAGRRRRDRHRLAEERQDASRRRAPSTTRTSRRTASTSWPAPSPGRR